MEGEGDLEAANELLKLKLELEHGLLHQDSDGLSPEMENQWLNYVYNFEALSKEAGRIKVYDFVGKPDFVPLQSLPKNQVADALATLEKVMDAKGVALDCLCEYDPAVLYQFITEELFEHEMDAIQMPGMVHHFTYEEFHPNHDYDIRKLVTEFIERLLTRSWNDEYDSLSLAPQVEFSGAEYDQAGMNAIIHAFQDANPTCTLEHFTIDDVLFDTATGTGIVKAGIAYQVQQSAAVTSPITGACTFHVVLDDGYWNIASIKLPGFGQ